METKMVRNEQQKVKPQKEYIEILGDTVVPVRILSAIVISICLSIGGYFLGKNIFPKFAEAKMVGSYSLLLGIAGSVIGLIICANLFKPSRILTEEETGSEGLEEILLSMQVDPKAEYDLIKDDPVTRKEMEELGILETFKRSGGRTEQ
ncbi:hypothetical protein [Brevibacillus nitrificans]|uniref:hypothetical protein n=1 Tax=Brevibacillus nitrificans TaxID=651560 RepID=UPI00285B0D93|nr:hypothetical protein [Brevibacillus nitrificans]MDR7314638.1 putative membrane protein YeaQ/YmgE (transglycosylase-associated protein family) [Brevibacillus nitrificans]